MIALLALPVAIIVSLCWYLPIVKALGNNTALKMGDYLYIALVGGFGFTCIFIIITELAWDRAWATLMGSQVRSDLFANFMSDFFRAALLEELFKFLGFKLALNKYQPKRKIDYMPDWPCVWRSREGRLGQHRRRACGPGHSHAHHLAAQPGRALL